jgi:hypothetical protein
MSDVEKLQARDNLLKEIEEYKANNVEKEAQIADIESQMSQIKNYVQNMCGKFGQSHFKLSVAEPMEYNEGTEFNEKNVT